MLASEYTYTKQQEMLQIKLMHSFQRLLAGMQECLRPWEHLHTTSATRQ